MVEGLYFLIAPFWTYNYYVDVCSDHVHDPANQVLRSILQQRRAKVVPNLPLPGGGRGNGRGSLTGK